MRLLARLLAAFVSVKPSGFCPEQPPAHVLTTEAIEVRDDRDQGLVECFVPPIMPSDPEELAAIRASFKAFCDGVDKLEAERYEASRNLPVSVR